MFWSIPPCNRMRCSPENMKRSGRSSKRPRLWLWRWHCGGLERRSARCWCQGSEQNEEAEELAQEEESGSWSEPAPPLFVTLTKASNLTCQKFRLSIYQRRVYRKGRPTGKFEITSYVEVYVKAFCPSHQTMCEHKVLLRLNVKLV